MSELAGILQSGLDGLGPAWVKGPDGRYLAVGAALADHVGAEPDAMLGRSDEEFWPSSAVRQFRADDHAALARGRGAVVPEHGADRHGFVVTVKLPLTTRTGDLVGTLGSFDRADAGDWIRQARARYRTVLATLGPTLDALGLSGHRTGLDRGYRDRPALASPTIPPWLEAVRSRVIARFRRRVRVVELAERAGVHPSHLGRAFRDAFGVHVHGFVRRLRIDWACVELRSTRRAAGEIGLAAGFSDQSHFTREFRRVMGVSPSRYRRNAGRG